MVDKIYPIITQMMVDRKNSAHSEAPCMNDPDCKAAFARIKAYENKLAELFVNLNPSPEEAELFKRYLYELDSDGYSDVLSIECEYNYVEGFVTASKMFMEIIK